MTTNNNGTRGQGVSRPPRGKLIKLSGQTDLLIRLGDEKFAAGDFIGALKMYRRAYHSADESSVVVFRIAETLIEMRCFADALDWIAPLLIPDTDDYALALFYLGHCMLGRGEYVAAADAFSSFASAPGVDKLDPDIAGNAFECLDFCEQNLQLEEADQRALRDSDEVEIEEAMDTALELADAGKRVEALNILEAAFERHPDSKELFADLLLSLYCVNRSAEGVQRFNAASTRLTDNFAAQCCGAMLAHAVSDEAMEEACCERLFKYTLTDVTDMVRAFTVMIELGRNDKAFEYAKRAYELDPYNKGIIHFCGNAAYRVFDILLSRSYYERILAIDPNDSVASYYKSACEDSIMDGKERNIQTEYAVPPAEFVRRFEYTEALSHKSHDELKSLWKTQRHKLLTMLDWSLSDPHSPFADFYLSLLLMVDKRYAEGVLRRILIEPEYPQRLYVSAAARLRSIDPEARFLKYNDGSISCCAFTNNIDASKLPAGYRRLFRLVERELENSTSEIKHRGELLAIAFSLESSKAQPHLAYGQIEAMAAAIAFVALKDTDGAADMDTFASARGITTRRLENALAKLGNVLAKLNGEGAYGDE